MGGVSLRNQKELEEEASQNKVCYVCGKIEHSMWVEVESVGLL